LADPKKVHIIGIGEDGLDGLSAASKRLLEQADLILGDQHSLGLLSHIPPERRKTAGPLNELLQQVEAAKDKRLVLLTSGDPMFYGTARYLCDKLGKDRFEVIPHVSSMQLAFARVKESWEEAYLTNLANHPLESVLDTVRGAEKVGLFTSDETPPAAVARGLLDRHIDYFTGYVCENLGSPDERVTHGELSELAEQDFAPLNVMILVRKPSVPDRPNHALGRRLFGNPDEAFLQSRPKRGLLTPAETRAMALAEMDLGPSSVVWEIGAGSGSVAVEAAQIASQGTVYAIEMDPEDHQLIIENAKHFGVSNLVPVLGRAPEAWSGLPDPDAAFIGGSGTGMSPLVKAAFERLKVGGRLVATMGSIDNLAQTNQLLRALCDDVKLCMINLARGNYQLGRVRFEALNPTFLISVIKPG